MPSKQSDDLASPSKQERETDENDPNTWGFKDYGPPPDSIDGIIFNRNGSVEDCPNWGIWISQSQKWSTTADGIVWSWDIIQKVWVIDAYLLSREWHRDFPDAEGQAREASGWPPLR